MLERERRAMEVANSIAEMIMAKYSVVNEVSLFGSYAKGTSRVMSDIDILVVTDTQLTDRYLRGELRDEVDAIGCQYGFDTDLVFTTAEGLKENTRFNSEVSNRKVLCRR